MLSTWAEETNSILNFIQVAWRAAMLHACRAAACRKPPPWSGRVWAIEICHVSRNPSRRHPNDHAATHDHRASNGASRRRVSRREIGRRAPMLHACRAAACRKPPPWIGRVWAVEICHVSQSEYSRRPHDRAATPDRWASSGALLRRVSRREVDRRADVGRVGVLQAWSDLGPAVENRPT